MIISIDWIKDFVDLPDMDPKKLGEKFTLATCEVEDVKTTGELLDKVSVVEITEVNDHPNSEKLHLVTFNTGNGSKEVVCGAPNVAPGKKVPYAPLGTTFPGGFTLEPKKIRGVLSDGMLCSEVELALGSDDSGLMELPSDAPVGTSMAEFLNIKKDILLEIDNKSITHRPDLWGHFGMAREFSAVFGNPLKKTFDSSWEKKLMDLTGKGSSPVSLKVDPESYCLRYLGLSIDNVKVQDSPLWIQNRLIACGLRPINNIVDISNYVMLELGVPNHIFDREMIGGGEVNIRTLQEDEKFITLDEQERELLKGDTVIADASKPLVIAGIMGGLESGVTEKTTQIFLETATFKAGPVRRASTRLGLRTDSSQRYEKSLDPNLLNRTMLRLVELILESCPEAQVIGDIQEDGHYSYQPLTLKTSADRISSVLGKKISTDEVVSILESLEYGVENSNGDLIVSVPSYRATKDVEYEADLVEEIGRIIGFDNIEPVPPHNEIQAVRLSEARQLQRQIQDFMVQRGNAYEVMTYPFAGEKLLEKAKWPVKNEELVLINALNPEHSRMRPSMIPNLLEAAALNQKKYSSFRFFETGRSFIADSKNFSQDRYQTGIVFYSRTGSPFMDLMNTVEELMNHTDIPVQMQPGMIGDKHPLAPAEWPGLHPHEAVNMRIMGKNSGFIASIHPLILRNFKIKGQLAMAIFDTTDFQDRPRKSKIKYQPLPKFPSSEFDCTVVVENKTPAADILASLRKIKINELEGVHVVDVYQLNDEQKTVTLRASFLDREKTLKGDFLKEAEDRIVSTLEKAGYPLKRA